MKKASDGWDKGQVVVQPLDGGDRKTLVDGGADGRYLPTGHLVYAVSGMLLAIPFDARSLTVSGGPVPVVEGVRRAGAAGPQSAASAQFSYASNGSLVYVPGPVSTASSAGLDLAIFDRKGVAQPLELLPGPYRSPRVSPDGKSVAFDSEDESDAVVWVYDLGGTSAIRRLTFGGKNRAPVRSADGQWIAFQSDREGDLAIFRQRADGSGTAERMTKPDKGASHTPESWSPDGAHLLFTVLQDRSYSLWDLAMKDRRTSPFANVQSPALVQAAFSPDGRWVAYQSREPGGAPDPTGGSGNSIYVQPFPPTGAKYQVPIAAGHPMWSRKGDEIMFGAGPTRDASISVTTTPRFAFGRPDVHARGGWFAFNSAVTRRSVDVMPDGRILGIVSADAAQSGSASAPKITVVLNWFDEVRQRAPQP